MRLRRVDIVSSPTERLVTGVGRYEGSIEASKKRVYCSWRSSLRRRAPEERRRHGPCSSAKPPRPSEWVSLPVLWARGYHAPDVRLVRSACGASRWFISVSERLSSFLSLCVNSVSYITSSWCLFCWYPFAVSTWGQSRQACLATAFEEYQRLNDISYELTLEDNESLRTVEWAMATVIPKSDTKSQWIRSCSSYKPYKLYCEAKYAVLFCKRERKLIILALLELLFFYLKLVIPIFLIGVTVRLLIWNKPIVDSEIRQSPRERSALHH